MRSWSFFVRVVYGSHWKVSFDPRISNVVPQTVALKLVIIIAPATAASSDGNSHPLSTPFAGRLRWKRGMRRRRGSVIDFRVRRTGSAVQRDRVYRFDDGFGCERRLGGFMPVSETGNEKKKKRKSLFLNRPTLLSGSTYAFVCTTHGALCFKS